MNRYLLLFLSFIISLSANAQQKKPQTSSATIIANLTAKLESAQQQNRKLRADLATTTATLIRLRKENEQFASSGKPISKINSRSNHTVNLQYLKDSIRAALIKSGEIRTVTVNTPPVTPKNTPPIAASGRLDACIQKNRQLAAEISTFTNKYQQLEIELNTAKYYAEQNKKYVSVVRDSVKMSQKSLISYQKQVQQEMQATFDSLDILRKFKDDVVNEKQRTISDTNIVRVYDLPVDVVRIKVLRKVLDETSGLLLEKNMDDGFVVSRIYRDRYAEGMFKRVMSTKIDCTIKMLPHPLDPEKTIFYTNTKLQDRKQDKLPFTEQADSKLVKDYQNKLLSFFDSFLVK